MALDARDRSMVSPAACGGSAASHRDGRGARRSRREEEVSGIFDRRATPSAGIHRPSPRMARTKSGAIVRTTREGGSANAAGLPPPAATSYVRSASRSDVERPLHRVAGKARHHRTDDGTHHIRDWPAEADRLALDRRAAGHRFVAPPRPQRPQEPAILARRRITLPADLADPRRDAVAGDTPRTEPRVADVVFGVVVRGQHLRSRDRQQHQIAIRPLREDAGRHDVRLLE